MSGSPDRVTMARGAALVFGAGATMVSITLLLPHREGEAELGLLFPVAFAYPMALLLFAAPQRFSPRVLSGLVAFGTLLVGVCVIYGGTTGGLYAFMYVWVALYAAAFFSLRETVAHVVWAFASFAVLLAVMDDVRPPATHWLMIAGTSTVAATLILGLTRELRARAADLAAVTRLANEIGSVSEVSGAEVADRICRGVLTSSGGASALLLEDPGDGSAVRALGSAGGGQAAAVLREPDGTRVIDEATRSGRTATLRTGDGICGTAEPVRRDGRVRGVLLVVWDRPRRTLGSRVDESVALFAAEAGVALERMAGQSRDRRRRALELNDEIVQGLIVAKYALSDGRTEMGQEALDATLERARALVESQLQDLHGATAPEPGSLRVGGTDPAPG